MYYEPTIVMQKNTSSYTLKSGFTLIELLVVAALIIVITSIGMVNFRASNQKARNSKREADISQVRSALELYRATNSAYPIYSSSNQVTNFANLMNDNGFRAYLATPSITDPVNTAPYRYTYQSAASGFTYTICYYAEPSGTQTCQSNP